MYQARLTKEEEEMSKSTSIMSPAAPQECSYLSIFYGFCMKSSSSFSSSVATTCSASGTNSNRDTTGGTSTADRDARTRNVKEVTGDYIFQSVESHYRCSHFQSTTEAAAFVLRIVSLDSRLDDKIPNIGSISAVIRRYPRAIFYNGTIPGSVLSAPPTDEYHRNLEAIISSSSALQLACKYSKSAEFVLTMLEAAIRLAVHESPYDWWYSLPPALLRSPRVASRRSSLLHTFLHLLYCCNNMLAWGEGTATGYNNHDEGMDSKNKKPQCSTLMTMSDTNDLMQVLPSLPMTNKVNADRSYIMNTATSSSSWYRDVIMISSLMDTLFYRKDTNICSQVLRLMFSRAAIVQKQDTQINSAATKTGSGTTTTTDKTATTFISHHNQQDDLHSSLVLHQQEDNNRESMKMKSQQRKVVEDYDHEKSSNLDIDEQNILQENGNKLQLVPLEDHLLDNSMTNHDFFLLGIIALFEKAATRSHTETLRALLDICPEAIFQRNPDNLYMPLQNTVLDFRYESNPRELVNYLPENEWGERIEFILNQGIMFQISSRASPYLVGGLFAVDSHVDGFLEEIIHLLGEKQCWEILTVCLEKYSYDDVPILHAAIGKTYRDTIIGVIKHFKTAAFMRDKSDELAIHVAIKKGMIWKNGLCDIVAANPMALKGIEVYPGLSSLALADVRLELLEENGEEEGSHEATAKRRPIVESMTLYELYCLVSSMQQNKKAAVTSTVVPTSTRSHSQ